MVKNGRPIGRPFLRVTRARVYLCRTGMERSLEDHDHVARELAEQYADSTRLAARQQIYRYAGTGGTSWHRWIFDHFDLPRGAPARILELGCGNAELWRQNLDRIPARWDITISDLSPGMLRDAIRGLGDRSQRFHIARIDAQRVPFDAGSFDLVVANHMLYHVPDRARACREIRGILKPAGRFLAATNSQDHMLELHKLIDRHLPPAINFPTLNFTLESGQVELQKYFDQVDVHRLHGELRVPQAQPIVEYIRSIVPADADCDRELEMIRIEVQRQIDRRGIFRATTETGLFCAHSLSL